MKTMLTTLSIIVAIAMFLVMARTTIQFNPFKITAEAWMTSLGYAMLIAGSLLIAADFYARGTRDSEETTIQLLKEMVKECPKEK